MEIKALTENDLGNYAIKKFQTTENDSIFYVA